MVTAEHVDPFVRRKLGDHLLAPDGGLLLLKIVSDRREAIIREAGELILTSTDDERLLTSLRPLREEATHLGFLEEAIGILANECRGT